MYICVYVYTYRYVQTCIYMYLYKIMYSPPLQKEFAGHVAHSPPSSPVNAALQRQRERVSLPTGLEALSGHDTQELAPGASL